MERDNRLSINDEVSALVYQSLTPPQIPNMGAGSVMDNEQHAKWIGGMERRWQTAYTAADGVSPEAIRVLQLIGAEFGFVRRGRKMRLDSSSTALFSVLC